MPKPEKIKHYVHRTVDPKRTIGGRYVKKLLIDWKPQCFHDELRKQLIQSLRTSNTPNTTAQEICAEAKARHEHQFA